MLATGMTITVLFKKEKKGNTMERKAEVPFHLRGQPGRC